MTPACVLLALLAAAPAPPADDPVQAGVRAGFDELEAWDPEAAHRRADEALKRAPDDLSVQELIAHVKFEEGDYAGAVSILDKLEKAGQATDAAFLELARATMKVTEDHVTRESEHFVISFNQGRNVVLVPYALETLEKQRAALAQQLGWAPPGKTRVEVLENDQQLARVSTLTLEAIRTSGTIALCKFDRLMFISPGALVVGYEWQDTLAHEYTHYVVSKLSRNTVPIWLHEGLAKFFESSWRGAPGLGISPPMLALLAESLKKNKLISFERMHPSMALLPSQLDAALAFAEVFTAVEYLYGKGGSALLLKIIENLKAGQRYDAAIASALGVSFSRFQSDWTGYLAKRDFPRETLPLSALHFKDEDQRKADEKASKDPKKDELARFGDFMEIADVEGRKLAHLGELLRVRNRPAAAIEEFQKAYARVGNRSATLSNAYAQALMKTGNLARAEELLQASLKPFPGEARTERHLAEIFLQGKRWSEAEHALLAVIAIDPFDPRPHQGLLAVYDALHDGPREAREKSVRDILLGKENDLPGAGKGTVTVRCHPLARIFVDGVDTGRTTPAKVELAPGSHLLKLVNEERDFTREVPVEIGANEEKTVEIGADSSLPASP